mgnify:CR=1 FL=1
MRARLYYFSYAAFFPHASNEKKRITESRKGQKRKKLRRKKETTPRTLPRPSAHVYPNISFPEKVSFSLFPLPFDIISSQFTTKETKVLSSKIPCASIIVRTAHFFFFSFAKILSVNTRVLFCREIFIGYAVFYRVLLIMPPTARDFLPLPSESFFITCLT